MIVYAVMFTNFQSEKELIGLFSSVERAQEEIDKFDQSSSMDIEEMAVED